jgi:epoxyqueuosine reductase
MLDLKQKIKEQFNFDQVGFTRLERPLTIDFYKKWIQNDYHGEMNYLQLHTDSKETPQLLNPQLKSALSITQSYYPAPEPTSTKYPARIALYARNNDYHFWLKDKLQKTIDLLKLKFPNDIFLPHVDSGPVLERDLAYKAGLGWFGKNTCLIHPKHGSLFFIAEILTSLDPDPFMNSPIEPLPDFCGQCTKCIDICPTQAIKDPRTLKADECISYLTIESKKSPPLELRSKINDWFFGCDLCQTVCPWNQKVFRQKEIQDPILTSTEKTLSNFDKSEQIEFFRSLLTSSNKQIQKRFFGTALFRAGGFGLKRNALIVIGNQKILELKNDVIPLLKDPKLGELADWCLTQLKD